MAHLILFITYQLDERHLRSIRSDRKLKTPIKYSLPINETLGHFIHRYYMVKTTIMQFLVM